MFPRRQVDRLGVDLAVLLLPRRNFTVDQHEDDEVEEDQTEEVVVVHRLDDAVEGRHEVEGHV